jgi:beta-lactamase class A
MNRLAGIGVCIVLIFASFTRAAVKEASEKFTEQKLKTDDVSVTIIDMHDPAKLTFGHFQGDKQLYPASTIKLFYLGAVHRWLEDGKLKDAPELRRAMSDMIIDSDNDATGWILEALTDAGNGPLLEGDELKAWEEKRGLVNRYYRSLGYTGVNACQKTYNGAPYGRDKLWLAGGKNRNYVTSNDAGKLMATIALGKMVTPDRSKQMMDLLKRDMTTASKGSDDQAHGFSAMVLPKEAKLWSKAGWTKDSRHDIAYIEMPDGRKLVSVVYTTGHGYQKQILPDIVGRILAGFEGK